MEKRLSLGALVLASTVLLAACGNVGGGASSTGTKIGKDIKVGYNWELSGNVSSYGNSMKNGADLAVKEINAAGGVGGKKLKVLSQDNKSENAEAATVATNLVTKGANVIIGPATSGAAASSTPKVNAAAVPMIAPAATQDNLVYGSDGKTLNQYFFRATFVDNYQGKLLSQYATDNLKAKKVVLFYDNSSDYSKGVAKSFKESYSGKIVDSMTFSAGDTDFQASLTKLKGKEYDAIVMPGYYTETGLIVKQARDLGISKPVFGPDGFDSPKFVQSATPVGASNVYYLTGFTTQGSTKAKAFHDHYVKAYGEEPSMFSALSYDAVYMAAKSAKGAKTSIDLKKALAKLKDFKGVTGKMSIDKNHNVVKSAYVVKLDDGKTSSVNIISAK
ncbi:TPA: ABC transporter substrate-binding protein [Streptococcus agalactiae]|nr:ABC transporter substrate-binding protein [Streptococcus agalactiae]HEO4735602.1 ABC transporter substrate-binding protein [Streptococcus agalactiae]